MYELIIRCVNQQMGIMTIIFLVALVPLAASVRDLTLTANFTGDTYAVWDPALKTVDNCTGFHTADLSRYFFIWPEDMPEFHYCCQPNGTLSIPSLTATNQFIKPLGRNDLQKFVYHQYGQPLQVATYYDLQSVVDPCLPYWKCWGSEPLQVTNFITFALVCETSDLRRFYSNKLWKTAIWKAGILMSALPLIGFLELGVLTTLALGYLFRFVTSPWKRILELWWEAVSVIKFRTWLHLTLLTVVGNCFIEAIVLTPVYSWESTMMNNYAFIYLLLPIGVWIAAFVQQVTDWRLVDICILQKLKSEDVMEKLRFEFDSEDWRWQPIFLQIATLSMLMLYITYGASLDRQEYVALLLGVASVATTWSFIVAVVLLSRKSILLAASFKSAFVVFRRSQTSKRYSRGSRNYQRDPDV